MEVRVIPAAYAQARALSSLSVDMGLVQAKTGGDQRHLRRSRPPFHDISAEWISDMSRMEETDRQTPENPRTSIVDRALTIHLRQKAAKGRTRPRAPCYRNRASRDDMVGSAGRPDMAAADHGEKMGERS